MTIHRPTTECAFTCMTQKAQCPEFTHQYYHIHNIMESNSIGWVVCVSVVNPLVPCLISTDKKNKYII